MKSPVDHEVNVATAKMGVAGVGAAASALTAQEWVALLTILYLMLQIGLLLPKYWKLLKVFWQKEDGRLSLRTGLIGGIGATALAIATPFVGGWEGKSNETYLDPVGIPTACYGYTIGVEMGQVYTDEECYHLLNQELQHAAKVVNTSVHVPLTAERKAALMSFVYNVGATNFKRSTLLRKLNSGDTIGACNELMRWVYARGVRLRGLENRRRAERDLCLAGL